MEIESYNDGLLTNIEVAELLEETKSIRKINYAISPELQNREAIETQTIKYIRQSVIKNSSSKHHIEFGKTLKEMQLDLTEGETLQLMNHCPSHPVEVHLIVEECAERLSDEAVASIINLSDKHVIQHQQN
mmetsp:Transcript_25371/g.25599  ORF Transcript_25371/g.25599 Transcript_25371/m.25599 type:complete len:131 (-) Transcript_25371:83-475(-)